TSKASPGSSTPRTQTPTTNNYAKCSTRSGSSKTHPKSAAADPSWASSSTASTNSPRPSSPPTTTTSSDAPHTGSTNSSSARRCPANDHNREPDVRPLDRECHRNCVGTSERDRHAYYYAGSDGVAGA